MKQVFSGQGISGSWNYTRMWVREIASSDRLILGL